MGATGTITHIDGDRVYAFGHPVLQSRARRVPDDARLRLHDPAEPAVVVQDLVDGRRDRDDAAGSRDGDRRHARQGPALVPMTVTLEQSRGTPAGGARTAKRTFKYTLVNDQLFTPLSPTSRCSTRSASYERQFGASTIHRQEPRAHQGTRRPERRGRLHRRHRRSLGAATAVAGPITMLLANDIEPITLEGLDITITSAEDAAHARPSSASGSTTSGRAPAGRCRSRC